MILSLLVDLSSKQSCTEYKDDIEVETTEGPRNSDKRGIIKRKKAHKYAYFW
jgi:hypothetical protein